MALINTSYFIRDIEIPNTDQDQVAENLGAYIDKYEKEVLTFLLGYTLYKDLIANPTDQRWVDFLAGREFSFQLNGRTVNTKWEGLINSTTKESLIAYYVFYKFLHSSLRSVAGVGAVSEIIVENSENVSAASVLAKAWDKFLTLYGDLEDHDPYQIIYFDKYGLLSSYPVVNDKPSAYNFLLANKDSYSGWIFEPKGSINQFGI